MSLIFSGAQWLTEEVASKLFEKFSENVLERWSKHRRNEFFKSFCEEFQKELYLKEPQSKVDNAFEELLKKDKTSEILFEAYRQVSLAKSKTLGPRIIGYLTATLVLQDILANEDDEMIFEIAEKSSDADLLAFASFYDENVEHSKNKDKRVYNVSLSEHGELRILLGTEVFNSSWRRQKTSVNLTPVNLGEYIGDWAIRYKNLGVIVEEVSEETLEYGADPERHIDEDGTERTISWVIIIPGRFKRLRDYIGRAKLNNLE